MHPQLTGRKVARWRLLAMRQIFGDDEKIDLALDDAIKALDTAIAEVEVLTPKQKEV
jgi:hypothetical protein